jgi:hypothetical protein
MVILGKEEPYIQPTSNTSRIGAARTKTVDLVPHRVIGYSNHSQSRLVETHRQIQSDSISIGVKELL